MSLRHTLFLAVVGLVLTALPLAGGSPAKPPEKDRVELAATRLAKFEHNLERLIQEDLSVWRELKDSMTQLKDGYEAQSRRIAALEGYAL
jgi:hypothetical protein